jgi:hypothetical protein
VGCIPQSMQATVHVAFWVLFRARQQPLGTRAVPDIVQSCGVGTVGVSFYFYITVTGISTAVERTLQSMQTGGAEVTGVIQASTVALNGNALPRSVQAAGVGIWVHNWHECGHWYPGSCLLACGGGVGTVGVKCTTVAIDSVRLSTCRPHVLALWGFGRQYIPQMGCRAFCFWQGTAG